VSRRYKRLHAPAHSFRRPAFRQSAYWNLFGAIQQHIALQEGDYERFYFIADFHALTTVHDAAKLRNFVRDAAVDYLALGLDPAKSSSSARATCRKYRNWRGCFRV